MTGWTPEHESTGRYVRRGRPDDLAALVELERAAFAEPWSIAGLIGELELPHARVWVWADGAEPLAGALLGWQIFEDFHVNRVAVRPDRRREGIGCALMLHAMAHARSEGAAATLLEVRADNAAALALYQRLGFVREGERRNYYGDGMAAVVMRKIM